MKSQNILICTKAYPEISQTYRETVCTAGLLLDENLNAVEWLRIYPVRFRLLEHDKRFQKWSIINGKIERNPKDFREESHRIDDSSIILIDKIKHDATWQRVVDYLLPFKVLSTNYLRETGQTLGLIKPREITSVFL